MDLSSIMNSDSTTQGLPPSIPKLKSPVKQSHGDHQRLHQTPFNGAAVNYQHSHRNPRPPQPAPLQPPGPREIQSPSGTASHRSAQSPYQNTPTSSFGGTQFPFPQPASQGQAYAVQASQYQQRDHNVPAIAPNLQGYGQPSPSLLTPTATTPGSSHTYSQYQRPQSSHSSATPTSAQSHTQHFPRDSPSATHDDAGIISQQHPARHYQSQPGTPLGPPQSVGRPSPVSHREMSGPYPFDVHRSQSSSSFGRSQMPMISPTVETPTAIATSPDTYVSRIPPPSRSRSYRTDEDRERSLSVSPKTRLPSQTKSEFVDVQSRVWNGGVVPSKRKITNETAEVKPPLHSIHQTPILNDIRPEVKPVNGTYTSSGSEQDKSRPERELALKQTPPHISSLAKTVSSPVHPNKSHSRGPSVGGNSASAMSSVMPLQHQQSAPLHAHQLSTPPSSGNVPLSTTTVASVHPSVPQSTDPVNSPSPKRSPQQPAKKRRFETPPIYAQSSRKLARTGAGNSLMPNKRRAPSKPAIKQELNDARNHGPHPSNISASNDESNGYRAATPEIPIPKVQPKSTGPGPLGPWEPTISNIIPHEELTRRVADFIFTEVINRNDIGTGNAAGGAGANAVLEIEAKLGHIIDQNTNDRLRLPVLTECVISKNDPNLRTRWDSSMTEAEHRTLNKFLNEAVTSSLTPKGSISQPVQTLLIPRIPMTYVHTYESDSFYELSPAAEMMLPPSIRAQVNLRSSKAKVRITTDQKTGKTLAKIIKVRVADMDVYNPQAPFDWRISINLEMNFEGNMRDLVEVMEGGKQSRERNKDRMTYRHLAYQIDLTQVTPNDATSHAEKMHELEIELATAEVRKQGNLLKVGQPSGYEELIKGFVDNVRILTRQFR